ncbi:MAG: tRNA-dihydrouridine synthase family protein [Muribaculaceae bacterium]|nr:tRNA-dihydrouridine synthase family protein [Muribaculaceae bacterium]
MTKSLHIAPIQGHTDAAWRHFHKEIYGGNHSYYTPFIRLERGEFRKHDLKDYLSPLNENHEVVAQVIFKDMEELGALLEGLAGKGVKRIDLNSGCPFPLQTARGRGAAFVGNKEEFGKLPEMLARFPEIEFSLKMRLGFENPGEWRGVIDIINDLPLHHITLHPRVAKDQYKGEVRLDEFSDFLSASNNPMIYNGDLITPQDIAGIENRFPEIAGVMVGRGLLGRPSLAAEYSQSEEWNKDRRIKEMMKFHDRLFDYYSSELCGDHQVLSKIKPFWEYAESEIGRKAWKSISKASNMAKYQSALALIDR